MNFRESVSAVVESLVGSRIDLSRPYRMRVVTQHADGTLDLEPVDTKKLPPMVRVAIAYGEPGMRAKVRKGAIVYVEFAEGDAASPIVRGWESGAVEELTLDADRVRLADGDMPLARRGDLIAVKLPVGAAGGTSILWSPIIDPTPTATAYGTIVSGSSKVGSG